MAIREKLIIDAEDQASREFDKASGSFGKLEGVLKKAAIGGGLAIATKKLIDLGVQSTKLAVDAAEAASAFDTTFGPAVGDAAQFVDEFANKAGLAEFQLQQMLATAGNVAQGIGATEQESAELAETMAVLAGDVASFSNAAGGSEAVLMALQSALTGEREALKTYGIAISETEVQQRALTDTNKLAVDELTRLEKANATMALAYEKAGKAVGDLDRTQDSSANSMRRIGALFTELKVTIGEQLIPALDGVLPAAESALRQMIVLASDGAGPLQKALDGLVLAWDALLIAFFRVQATEAAQSMADTVVVARELRDRIAETGNVTTEFANGLSALLEKGSLTQETFEFLAGSVGASRDQQLLALEALREYNIEQSAAADGWNEYGQEIDTVIMLTGTITDAIEAEEAALRAAATATMGDARELENLGSITKKFVPVNKSLEESLAGVHAQLVANATSTRDLMDAQRAQTDPVFRAMDAWNNYQRVLAEVDEDNVRTAEELFDLTEASLDLRSALQLDPGQWEAAMQAIQTETGLSRDEVEELFGAMGEFDGKTFDASVNVGVNVEQPNLPIFDPGFSLPAPSPSPLPPIPPTNFLEGTGLRQSVDSGTPVAVSFGDIVVTVTGSDETAGIAVADSVVAAIEAVMS